LEAYGVRIAPVFLGKPYSPIFRHNHTELEKQSGETIERERVLMVGDTLAGDIKGGNDFGYTTALMLTGGTSRENLTGNTTKPDFIFEKL